MKESAPLRIMVALTSNDSLGRVVVTLDAYLRFSNEITCDLETFEDEMRERMRRGKTCDHQVTVDR